MVLEARAGLDRRVLVVDDERPLAHLVATYLNRAGYVAETCDDGATAIRRAREWEPAVVVLDLALPEVDGVDVCRGIREFSDCYVVMLTARSGETDTLTGLSVGADEYLTKPVSPRELVARVDALMRRPRHTSRPEGQVPLHVGRLTLDPAAREVDLEGHPVGLTRTEFDVLAALARRTGEALSRAQLLEEVWGSGWVADDNLVDVHIAHLRRKLSDDPTSPRFIHTVRGVGYRLSPTE